MEDKKHFRKIFFFLNSKLDIDMKGTKLSLQVSVIRAILSSGLNVALLTIAGILIMDGEMTIEI